MPTHLRAALAKAGRLIGFESAPTEAERLKRDWYYGHARYEDLPDGEARMTFGESRREFVFELVRWLGPGAELVEPQAWRAALRAELEEMAATYSGLAGT